MTYRELFTVEELARRLTHPSPVDHGLYSAVFVQVDTSHEGTLFLLDLAMELKNGGMQVIKMRGRDLIHSPLSAYSALSASSEGDSKNRSELTTTKALRDVVPLALQSPEKITAILIDEAEVLLGEPGMPVMKAFKAARDAVNLNPGRVGRLAIVASCAKPVRVEQFVSDSDAAFFGAAAIQVRKHSQNDSFSVDGARDTDP